eukprot:TRINITY_DN9871_c0_g2_i1.p1 TRINITY_DN9871_c0_g2~~TRINITY_DN9871_c0_g2_i1.p1  ORF type:complete len:122 (+),score=0.28 TRINITY_DN9871_c0_g2_i1:33-398(+)
MPKLEVERNCALVPQNKISRDVRDFVNNRVAPVSQGTKGDVEATDENTLDRSDEMYLALISHCLTRRSDGHHRGQYESLSHPCSNANRTEHDRRRRQRPQLEFLLKELARFHIVFGKIRIY